MTVPTFRNCILSDGGGSVKIGDVSMGISLFNSDYSEVRGRSCAPIRWQAWETILMVGTSILATPNQHSCMGLRFFFATGTLDVK